MTGIAAPTREAQAPERFDDPPRFHAELPWIGPIVGDPGARPPFRIAGAVDPARMNAFGAAFVPVVWRDDDRGRRLVPADAQGKPCLVQDTGWVQPADRDAHGWFRIDAPLARWQDPVDGVLVALLYNVSRDIDYRTLSQAFPDKPTIDLSKYGYEIASDLQRAGAKARFGGRPLPDQLPALELVKIVAGIVWALDQLFERQDVRSLRSGLAQVPPPSRGDDLCFALGSCQYATGLLEEEVATASYRRLGALLDRDGGAPRPRALLLVGDQVYVDGSAGLFDPTAGFDRFVRPYEILHRLDAVRDVTRRLPTFMLLDDHEIVDNWEPRSDDVRPDPLMVEGRRSYMSFERAAGPPPRTPVGDSADPMWFEFDLAGFPFFMADTRTERTARRVGDFTPARIMSDDHARIMSRAQLERLRVWLKEQPAERPKLVASPSILLPRHRRAVQRGVAASALHSDGWDGYPGSFYRLLGWIAAEAIPNVIFLSGDEHLSCIARATLAPRDGGAATLIHSVHSSPLFGPFPFANSVRQDLIAREGFDFEANVPGHGVGSFRCEIETTFAAPGDGFALLRVRRDGGAAAGPWRLECRFDRDPAVAARGAVDFAYELQR
jgi:hypothetical protein